jgi:hypothetical protein
VVSVAASGVHLHRLFEHDADRLVQLGELLQARTAAASQPFDLADDQAALGTLECRETVAWASESTTTS